MLKLTEIERYISFTAFTELVLSLDGSPRVANLAVGAGASSPRRVRFDLNEFPGLLGDFHPSPVQAQQSERTRSSIHREAAGAGR